ncbi:MAG TPA: class II fructose-bisphosphate aldolase [Chloroflexi bacterium]|jgi:fructose-bisphosphate aldolase class II|nr:class II fructose-bisphosphate aldolase [Chloroflexota bacterium]
MPLVTSKELLQAAREGRFAVGAFNANNMEQIQAIVDAAVEERSPVILQVSQGAIRYAGLAFSAAMVKTAAAEADVPVVLHLDHGTDFEQNVRCLHVGFTSLMYDGSKAPYEENVATTRKIVEIAHICGIPVEAELGKVLQAADNVSEEEVRAAMTDPDQAADFVTRTGCDSLAVAIGSVHAMKDAQAELDIERLKELEAAVSIPMVLHGSSGVKEESEVEAIQHGIAKINVATMLNQAFTRALREALEARPETVDPRQLLINSREAVKEVVRHKMRLFGSSGKVTSSGGLVSPPTSHRTVDIGGAEE